MPDMRGEIFPSSLFYTQRQPDTMCLDTPAKVPRKASLSSHIQPCFKDCWTCIPGRGFPHIFLMAMLLEPWAHAGSRALWRGDQTLKRWLRSLQKHKPGLEPWGVHAYGIEPCTRDIWSPGLPRILAWRAISCIGPMSGQFFLWTSG